VKKKYIDVTIKHLIIVLLILSLSIVLISCNSKSDENVTDTKDNVNEDSNKVTDQDKPKDVIKLISNINTDEYIFEYTENNIDFKRENSLVYYFEKGVEDKPYKLLSTDGIESTNRQMKFKIKNLENKKVEVHCNGASFQKTTPYNEEYKEYKIINTDEIFVIDNEEIVVGAILYSKDDVEFSKENILSKLEELDSELEKFDFGFILTTKLSTSTDKESE